MVSTHHQFKQPFFSPVCIMRRENFRVRFEGWISEGAGRMYIPDQPYVLPELFHPDLIQENVQALS